MNASEVKPEPILEESSQESNLNIELIELKSKIETHEAALKQSQDSYLRALAETENVRRRAKIDLDNAYKYSNEKFARELLQVLDSLEKSLEHIQEDHPEQVLIEGIKLTHRLLVNTFEKFGIKQINPLGQPFDPKYHEALSMQETDQQDPNTVLSVLQTGFSYNDRILRPARVIVAAALSVDPE